MSIKEKNNDDYVGFRLPNLLKIIAIELKIDLAETCREAIKKAVKKQCKEDSDGRTKSKRSR